MSQRFRAWDGSWRINAHVICACVVPSGGCASHLTVEVHLPLPVVFVKVLHQGVVHHPRVVDEDVDRTEGALRVTHHLTHLTASTSRLSLTKSQLSLTKYQLSLIKYQLSLTKSQLSLTRHKISAVTNQISAARHQISAVNIGWQLSTLCCQSNLNCQ